MNKLIDLLKINGPLTGKEIAEKSPLNIFDLWKSCNRCTDVIMTTVGTRYLRLDKDVEGFARLSPSIIREFYNYTVISLAEQAEAAHAKAERLRQGFIRISRNKFELARDIMEKIIESQPSPELIKENACFMIAGDVAYEMAHLEPRPEYSTGLIVNGSDLDIVVIHRNLPESVIKNLDSTIYGRKYYLLNNPSYKEEIDYVIKDLAKVDIQLAFDGFESMIASKILEESKFLCGSFQLFSEIKEMVLERGIPEKLNELTEKALEEREKARLQLLAFDNAIYDKEMRQLFFTTEEKEEFF